jgi:LuxR family maltose regulon positive regulatory protein
MADETNLAVAAGRSHIIQRPRLTRLLDESTARIILLVAPAGYGKTTLARQWLENRPHAWYRGTPASADVAALAVGIINAARGTVPHMGRKLQDRLRVTETPAPDIEVIVDLALSDLAAWPANAWIGFDDYQFVGDNREAERFLETLVRRSDISFLLTSRKRPSWVTARAVMYGEIFEVGRGVLAMTPDEGQVMLAGRPPREVPALLELAGGWPAVLGLASRTRYFDVPDRGERSALYEFFAEELFRDLPRDFQEGIAKLALAPSVDLPLATLVLGNIAADVIREGVRLGILAPQAGDAFELHPLLRAFLERKLARLDIKRTLNEVVRFLINETRWDEAFTIIERFHADEMLVDLVEAALPPILAVGRISTLTRWLSYAANAEISSPILDLAEAELTFREGAHARAQTLALQAEQQLNDSRLKSRALALAGESAYQRDYTVLALQLQRRAARCARTRSDRRRAIWGQFLAAIQLEEPCAPHLLHEVEKSHSGTIEGTLRLATARLLLAGTGSHVEDLTNATRPIVHLVNRCSDPKIRTSFLSLLGSALALTSHYADAVAVIALARRDAADFRLAFAAPFACLVESTAAVGLRDFLHAADMLDACHELAEQYDDVFLDMSARAVRAKMFLAHGAVDDALRETSGEWSHIPGPVVLGEFLGVRALVLACANEGAQALAMADRAEAVTRGVEARTLAACTRAVVESRTRPSRFEAIQVAVATTLVTQNFDNLIATIRAEPNVAVRAAETPEFLPLLRRILTRSHDHALASLVGIQLPPRRVHPRELLSPREQEVFALLREGQTNRQIAAALFLSEATVKVHVRRILAKLGVRSRTQAVLKGPNSREGPPE